MRGRSTLSRLLLGLAVIGAGAALAISLGNRNSNVSSSDFSQLQGQVSSLEQQVSSANDNVRSQVDEALKPVQGATQQLEAIQRQEKANSAAIKHIDAYLQVHAPGYRPAP